MFWLKACPKCGGDTYAEGRAEALDIVCLQCGYTLSGDDRTLLLQRTRRQVQRRRAERLAGAR